MRYFVGLLCIAFMLLGCTTAPPKRVNNICKIFKEYPKWYWAAQDSQKKWGIPICAQMAIVHQESRFRAKAKPPRGKLLWVIPWKRPSSAYGYTQALNQTWEGYRRSASNGGADRDDFSDALDFVGWYGYQAHQKAGIDRRNTYALYLAYHEGIGGYQRGTYKNRKKTWLRKVAHNVQSRSNTYHSQLSRCEKSLKKKPWYRSLMGKL